MTKVFRCSDVLKECDFVARGETDEEVLQKAADHGKSAHNMEMTKDVEDIVRKLIREEPEAHLDDIKQLRDV